MILIPALAPGLLLGSPFPRWLTPMSMDAQSLSARLRLLADVVSAVANERPSVPGAHHGGP